MIRSSLLVELSAVAFAIAAPFAAMAAPALAPKSATDSKIATEQPVQIKKRFAFDGSIGYSVSSDFAQDRDPRLYTHRIFAGLGSTLLEKSSGDELVRLGIDATGMMKSVGNEIEARNQVVELADTDISLSNETSLGKALTGHHLLESTLGVSLPSSEASQFEGVRSVPFGSLRVISSFAEKRFSLTNGLSGSYVMNTYDYSPVTREINSDYSGAYSVSGSVRFLSKLRFSVGGSVKITHHLDDTNTLGFNNFQTLSLALGDFSAILRHSNGSHMQDKSVDLWYVDQYRRVVTFIVQYRF